MMTKYVVIQCNDCNEYSYIREQQKAYSCKRCGSKNNYTEIKDDLTAHEAKDFIVAKKSKNVPSGFTWVTG